jgi:hypothetical protein
MLKPYTFFTDPGHGWLAVPKAELTTLGIAHDISPYSYQHAGFVYLEEDCDLVKFYNAKGWRNWEDAKPFVQNEYQENTPIRHYQHFTP